MGIATCRCTPSPFFVNNLDKTTSYTFSSNPDPRFLCNQAKSCKDTASKYFSAPLEFVEKYFQNYFSQRLGDHRAHGGRSVHLKYCVFFHIFRISYLFLKFLRISIRNLICIPLLFFFFVFSVPLCLRERPFLYKFQRSPRRFKLRITTLIPLCYLIHIPVTGAK